MELRWQKYPQKGGANDVNCDKFTVFDAMQFQMSIIRDMIYGAASHGANFHQLCQKAGVTPKELNDSERMVDWEFSPHLWEYISDMTGDPLIGLHIGQEARPTGYGMIGYLLQACSTLGEAMEAVCRFNDTFSTIFRYSMEYKGDLVMQYMQPNALWTGKYPGSARQATDITKSSSIRVLGLLSGRNIRPVKALFSSPKQHADEYRRVLQCELEFNAPLNGLVFERSVLDIPVASHDESLFTLFNSLLMEKQKKLAVRKTFAEELRLVLLVDFKGQAPPIDVIASHMNMNTRTFQRRLAAENNSFRNVCHDLRKELALAIMQHDNKNVNEVAVLLGYADHTSFRRAFKHWTNALPGDVRIK